VRLIDPADRKAVFGPATPAISAVEEASGGLRLRLSFTDPDRADAVLRVYRDGRRVGDDLPGSAGSFVDSTGSPGHCYTVEAAYRSSGNTSHRARPICFWGPKRSRARSLAASSFEPAAAAIEDGARWLREGQELSAEFRAEAGGAHWFGAMAASGGPINTGITCALIRLRVQDAATGAEVGGGYLMAPHTGDASRFLRTSRVRVELVAGARYRVRLDTRDRHATNMSSLAHFQAYTGGAGGHGGAENRARLGSIEVRWGPATPP
jgi:hypothetical protein